MPRVTGQGAWAKARTSRARSQRWYQRRVHRASNAYDPDAAGMQDPKWSPTAEPPPEQPPKLCKAVIFRMVLLSRARALWEVSYDEHLLHEAKEAPELRLQVASVYAAQISSYRARLKDERLAGRYDLKTDRMVRDTTAQLRRRRNQLDIPFSILARSISYFNQRVPARVWKDQQKALRIVHRDTCMRLLDAMLEVEPAPPWLESQLVAVFGVDQNNCWQAAANSKRGEHRGAERLNAQGMPISIRSETVLNIVQRQIPFTEALLSPDEIKLVKDKGPYTEDPQLVKLLLDPNAVQQSEGEWMSTLMYLLGGGDDNGRNWSDTLRSELTQLPTTEREVMDRVLGKPNEKPNGPSPMKFRPSIPNCETQSFSDVAKMWAVLLTHCLRSCICVVIFCDGQLVELLRTCKRRWPVEYKRILIGNGHFHSLSHLTFCLNEGFWWCCLCTFALWQGKRKQIYHQMKDLQHDNAKHCLDFHRVNAAGILAYLVLDVVHPPPRLLLRDWRAYMSMVRVAGGIVILNYLLHAAAPILAFQRAIRAGPARGKECTRCMAFAFHCHRCFAFKVKSVYISLITLMGLACAHPKLQKVLENCCTITLLGRIWVAYDRLLEFLNDMQLKRGTAFRGFDTQLHFTHYLKALVHVDAAWKEAEGAGTAMDDGIASYLTNDVAEMRRMLRATLGTDLTKMVTGNALWHTGIPVPLDGGDYRERTPWEWRDAVTNGTSRGKGRAHPMGWKAFVEEWLAEHWL